MLAVISVSTDEHPLVIVGGNDKLIKVFLALLKIKPGPVRQVLVSHVRVSGGELEVLMVVLCSHPPQAIVCNFQANVLSGCIVPKIGLVTPWTVVGL